MTMMGYGGGGLGDAHEYDQSLLSFFGSKLSHHLHNINAKRVEATEGLLPLLFGRVEDKVSMTDLASIFITLGGSMTTTMAQLTADSGGGGPPGSLTSYNPRP